MQNFPSSLRRILVRSPAPSAPIPKVASPIPSRQRVSARQFKKWFIMSNYGRDLPSGWSFPAGVHAGKIKKLVRREEARVSALGSEERLLDLARQHFPPSTATERSGRDWDRKAYLEQRGPYVGRYLGQDGSRAFKLHASERKRPQRQADIKARLDKMDVQFAAYNKNKIEARARRRPAVPF